MSFLENKNRKLDSLLAEQKRLIMAREVLERQIATITDRLLSVNLNISQLERELIAVNDAANIIEEILKHESIL